LKHPTGPAIELAFAAWCSHCHHFAPTYCELAAALPPGVAIRAWDADKGAAEAAAAGLDIEGFPTIFLVDASGRRHQYTGGRDVPSMMSKLAALLPPDGAPRLAGEPELALTDLPPLPPPPPSHAGVRGTRQLSGGYVKATSPRSVGAGGGEGMRLTRSSGQRATRSGSASKRRTASPRRRQPAAAMAARSPSKAKAASPSRKGGARRAASPPRSVLKKTGKSAAGSPSRKGKRQQHVQWSQ